MPKVWNLVRPQSLSRSDSEPVGIEFPFCWVSKTASSSYIAREREREWGMTSATTHGLLCPCSKGLEATGSVAHRSRATPSVDTPLPASLSRFWMGLGRLSSLRNSRSKGAKDKGAIPETALKSKGTLRGDEPYGDSPRAQLMDFSGGE